MSDRLTAEPGTLEFLRQLLEIAQGSDHPMDKALVAVLRREISEVEKQEAVDEQLPLYIISRDDAKIWQEENESERQPKVQVIPEAERR